MCPKLLILLASVLVTASCSKVSAIRGGEASEPVGGGPTLTFERVAPASPAPLSPGGECDGVIAVVRGTATDEDSSYRACYPAGELDLHFTPGVVGASALGGDDPSTTGFSTEELAPIAEEDLKDLDEYTPKLEIIEPDASTPHNKRLESDESLTR